MLLHTLEDARFDPLGEPAFNSWMVLSTKLPVPLTFLRYTVRMIPVIVAVAGIENPKPDAVIRPEVNVGPTDVVA